MTPARALAGAVALLVLVAACTGPGGSSLQLAPDPLVLTAIGATAPLFAASSGGDPVAATTLVWGTLDPSVATVDALGHVRAVASGSTTVSAARPGGSGTAAVVVDATLLYRPCATVPQVGEAACGQVALTVTLD
jgi:hypothetical protein